MLTVAGSALDYYDRGWSVFPLLGKQPRVPWKEYQTVRPTREQVVAWWELWPDAGVGVVLGAVSSLVRVDADGAAAAAKYDELFGGVPETPYFVTPNHGSGVLYAYEAGVESTVLWKGDSPHEELRFMSDGSYTVVPPSSHPEGGVYEWMKPPWSSSLAKLPTPLLDAVRSVKTAQILKDLEHELKTTDVPDRELVLEALRFLSADDYERWVQVGMALKSIGEDVLAVWDEWSKTSPKYRPGDCERKWGTFGSCGGLTGRSIVFWAKQAGWVPPSPDFSLTDLGNSKRYTKMYKEVACYCVEWDKWLIWDGARWAVDKALQHMQNAKRCAEKLFAESLIEFARAVDEAKRSDLNNAQNKKNRAQKLYAWALLSQSAGKIASMVSLARSDAPVAPTALDRGEWLFNCPNGTLDLLTCSMREHRKEDMITCMCPTAYDAGASCPRWLQFLEEVFLGDASVIHWVQKFLGYCLTGSVKSQVFPVFHGDGSNGKSTLLNVVFDVIGPDYAWKASTELLMVTRNPLHATSKASLFGKRLVSVIETDRTARLNEATVKDLTGDDTVTCRKMYGDEWSFTPTHKFVMATNYMPEIHGTDTAIWRRIKRVPFLAEFSGTKKDEDLKVKLIAEAPGVLAWMVEGCRMWLEEGLDDAPSVAAATAVYREEQDRVSAFFEQHFERVAGNRVAKGRVKEKYLLWCTMNREKALSGVLFSKELMKRGYTADGNSWVGLKEK